MSAAPKKCFKISFHSAALQLMHNINYTNNNISSRSGPKKKSEKKLFTQF